MIHTADITCGNCGHHNRIALGLASAILCQQCKVTIELGESDDRQDYRICSKSGDDQGIWHGVDEADALAARHRDAGYDVTATDGVLVFANPSDEQICGGLDEWVIDAA